MPKIKSSIKEKKQIIAVIIALFCLFENSYCQAPIDGFNKGKGNATLVASYSLDAAKKFYGADGLVPAARALKAYSLFGVVGISDRFDAQISIPFVSSGSENNFQDISIYLKYALFEKGKTKILASLGQSSPLTNYRTSGSFAIGQQASALDARLILQQNIGDKLFFMAQGGYTNRSHPTPSSMAFSSKIGYASGKIYADLWFDFQQAFGGSDYGDKSGDPLTTLGVSYGKIGAQVYKSFNQHFGISVGGGGVLFGRNVGQALLLSVAFIYNL